MSGDLDQHQEITAALNALADDTDPEQVATVTRQFVNDDMITAAIARGAGGGGGSTTPPVTFTGTDPMVDQVTIAAAEDQDAATYILRIEDSEGNLVAGFDWSGVLDAIQGFRAGSLTPGEPFVTFANGVMIFTAAATGDAISVSIPAGDMFVVKPGATTAGFVQINTKDNAQVGMVINSFGGTADAIQYYGPPDFEGEFRVTSGGGVIFPSADPGVAGAWWDNAGTLTRSAG